MAECCRPIGNNGTLIGGNRLGVSRVSASLYAEVLDRLIDHLGLAKVYLLGHSHGGFVAQRYALDHAGRLAGLILYESAPATGEEHGAEAVRQVEEFARRNAGNPELPEVLNALQSARRTVARCQSRASTPHSTTGIAGSVER